MLHTQATLFGGVAGQREMNLAMRDGPASERIRADLVTTDFFSILRVRALYGRVLNPQDARAAESLPVVLSYAFWRRHFQSDPQVIGRAIWLQGRDAVIVGVTPREFNGLSVETSPDLRVPFDAIPTLTSDREQQRLEDNFLDLILCLHPGVTFAQAQSEFARI